MLWVSSIKKATPHYKSLPSESVEDNRVVTVNGIWVVWWQANIAQLHLIARDPMVHHSKARIKWRPPWKTRMVNYRKAVYLQLNSLHLGKQHLVSGSFFLQRPISKIALKSFFFSSYLYLFWIWELFFKGLIVPLFLTKNGWSNLHSAVNMPSSGEPGSKVSLRTAWPKDTVSSWLTNFSPPEPYLCKWYTRPIRKVFTHQLRMSLLEDVRWFETHSCTQSLPVSPLFAWLPPCGHYEPL